MGTMNEVEAAELVDWNVMAILIGIWIIAGYFGKTGVPSWLSVQSLKLSGGRPGLLILVLSMLTGILSMFIDNVVCILMMAPVALPLARALGIPATPLVLMIGFSANFMGTALLLGDLPPQMLHSVAGAEFFDFIWQDGRPSSFPILMTAFIITLAFMYVYGFRRIGKPSAAGAASIKSDIPDRLFAFIAVGMFLLTVLAMAMRETLGVKLGFIALTGAVILVLIVEILGDKLKGAPSFEHVVQELDWRAVFFYIALFALVGGLEKTHILQMMADAMKPIFAENFALGATLLFWITIPIVGLVEHDAYILTFLYMIRDLGTSGVPTWPLWWVVLWSGTLGSNLTVAGAPALYVALRIAEKEEDRKVSLREFLSWSLPFTLISSFVCYVLAMLIWVLPHSN
jgi:Na+/H+ antiporter NhaD/arsenite permease-like protein